MTMETLKSILRELGFSVKETDLAVFVEDTPFAVKFDNTYRKYRIYKKHFTGSYMLAQSFSEMDDALGMLAGKVYN